MQNEDISQRAAKAVAKAGSPEFAGNDGATRQFMGELARAGELEGLSSTYIAHVAAHPGDRRRLANRVPLIIANGYFCCHRSNLGTLVSRWCAANPGWNISLLRALEHPVRFAQVAQAMAEELEANGSA